MQGSNDGQCFMEHRALLQNLIRNTRNTAIERSKYNACANVCHANAPDVWAVANAADVWASNAYNAALTYKVGHLDNAIRKFFPNKCCRIKWRCYKIL